MNKRNLRDKGITLIALVVTVILLLILASVTIKSVMGEGGLLQMAKKATDLSRNAIEDEKEKLDGYLSWFNQTGGGDEGGNGNENPDEMYDVEIIVRDDTTLAEVSVDTSIMIYSDQNFENLVKEVPIKGSIADTKLPIGKYYCTLKEAPEGYRERGSLPASYGADNFLIFCNFSVLDESGSGADLYLYKRTYEEDYDKSQKNIDINMAVQGFKTIVEESEDSGLESETNKCNINIYQIGQYNEATGKFEYVEQLKQLGYEGQVKINTYYQYKELGRKLLKSPINELIKYSGSGQENRHI